MDETTATIECFYCHQPVLASDALPCSFEDENGGEFIAVFHKPPKECAPLYAVERLETIALKLQLIYKNLFDAQKQLRKNNEQL